MQNFIKLYRNRNKFLHLLSPKFQISSPKFQEGSLRGPWLMKFEIWGLGVGSFFEWVILSHAKYSLIRGILGQIPITTFPIYPPPTIL